MGCESIVFLLPTDERGNDMAHKMVIHAANYKKNAVGALDKHNQRENENYSNPDIDHARTKDNITIHAPEISQYQDTKKIIEERAVNQVRKTSIWQTEFIISSDQEFFSALPIEEQHRFFQEAYGYLKKEFGEENVISAVAHFDETTPHMHFDFVPMTENNKLSRKEVMTRDRLLRIQDQLPKHMQEMGFDIERGQKMQDLTEKERLEHKHVDHAEYKKNLQGQINALEGQIGALNHQKVLLLEEERKEGLKRQIRVQEAQKKEKELQSRETKLESKEKELNSRKEKLQEGVKEYNTQLNSLQELPRGERTITGKIALQEEEYKKLLNTAKKGLIIEPELKELKRDNKKLLEQNKKLDKAYQDLKKEFPTLMERMRGNLKEADYQNMEKKVQQLIKENKTLKESLKKLAKMELPEPAHNLVNTVLDSFRKILQKDDITR